MKRKNGPRGRNFTPDERAIMLRVIVAGGGIDEVNDQLNSHQKAEGLTERKMPEASFSMMKNTYVKYLQNDDAVRDHVFHPSPLGKLRARRAVQEG